MTPSLLVLDERAVLAAKAAFVEEVEGSPSACRSELDHSRAVIAAIPAAIRAYISASGQAGEAVAWQWRQSSDGKWLQWNACWDSQSLSDNSDYWRKLASEVSEVQVRPLYTQPTIAGEAVAATPAMAKRAGEAYHEAVRGGSNLDQAMLIAMRAALVPIALEPAEGANRHEVSVAEYMSFHTTPAAEGAVNAELLAALPRFRLKGRLIGPEEINLMVEDEYGEFVKFADVKAAIASAPPREGWVTVPVEPSGEMMDAARHLFQWLAFSQPTERQLLQHCERRRVAPPPLCRDVDHVPPKRMQAYWIYRAMLSAPSPHGREGPPKPLSDYRQAGQCNCGDCLRIRQAGDNYRAAAPHGTGEGRP